MIAGNCFLLAAVVLLLLILVGINFMPNQVVAGLFFLSLGLLCAGVSLCWKSYQAEKKEDKCGK